MGHVCLLISQGHRSNESFHFDGFTGETFTNKRRLRHHPLPRLAFVLPGTHNFEYLLFRHSSNLWQRNRVLRSFLFSLLLDRRRHRLRISLVLSVEQEGRQGTFRRCVRVLLLHVSLVMRLERLLELHLFCMSFGVQQFSFQPKRFLGNGR